MKRILFCETMEQKMICRELCKPGAMLMNLISHAILITILSRALFRMAIAIPQKMTENSQRGFNLDQTSPSSETQADYQKLN